MSLPNPSLGERKSGRKKENGIGIARAGNPSWNVFFDSSRFASPPTLSLPKRERKKKTDDPHDSGSLYWEILYIEAFPCVFLRISRRLMKFRGEKCEFCFSSTTPSFLLRRRLEKTRKNLEKVLKFWKKFRYLKLISEFLKFWNSWNFYVIFEKHVVI